MIETSAGGTGMRVAPLLAVALAAGLSGCAALGGSKPKAPPTLVGTRGSADTVALGNGYGLNLPKTLDGFVRTDTDDRGQGRDFVGGYARTVDPAPIMATIRVHRVAAGSSLNPLASDAPDATERRSAEALDASIAQVRHFYPDAQVVDRGGAYIVRYGAMQQGRQATLRYVDDMDGTRQPILLRIDTFCCIDAKWAYEYRFRSPEALDATVPIAEFFRDMPWSVDPTNSIDHPN